MQMPSFEQHWAVAPRASRESEADQERVKLDRAVKGLEKNFLFDRMDMPHLRHRWDELEERFPGQPTQLLRALEGALHQERAEGTYRMFLLHQRNTEHRPITELTREDMAFAHEVFPHRQELEEEEAEAMRLYQEGGAKPWHGAYVNFMDVLALYADLQGRRAARTLNEYERAKMYRMADAIYDSVIICADEHGKKLEYQMIDLLRRWVREAQEDHVVEFRHGMPREDMKESTDAVCTIGTQQYNIQLKLLYKDAYRVKHHQEVVKEAQEQVRAVGAEVVVLDQLDVAEAYELMMQDQAKLTRPEKSKLTRLRRRLISQLSQGTSPELAALLLGPEKGEEESEGSPEGTRLTRKFIEANSPVLLLTRLGLLSESEATDPSRIIAAKKAVAHQATGLMKIFRAQESWREMRSDDLAHARELFKHEHAEAA